MTPSVVAAKVKISGGRGASVSGSDDMTKILKELLGEVQGFGRMFQKFSKMSQAGIFGGGGGSSKTGGTFKTIAAAFARKLGLPLAAAAAILSQIVGFGAEGPEQQLDQHQRQFNYEKVYIGDDTEAKVLKINQLTGKIEEVMTLEEAQHLGIVDDLGNMRSSFLSMNSNFDKITAGLPKVRDAVWLSAEYLDSITADTEIEKRLQKEIVRLQRIRAEKLARLAGEEMIEGSVVNTPSGPMSMGIGALPLFQQLIYQNNVVSEEPWARNRYEQSIRENVPFVDIYAGTSEGPY